MSLTAFDLPPPRTWQAFEALCHDIFSKEWGVADANRVGRNGQKQHGVDIIAKLASGWTGVQCKWVARTAEITPADLRKIAEEALEFRPPLSRLVVATTSPNDAPLQLEARRICEDHARDGLFSISLFGWDDLCAKFDSYPDVVAHHYAALSRFGRRDEIVRTEYSTRIENFKRQYLGDDEQLVPFIGREMELAALDEWLADNKRSYEIIRAPAGRGKSALLASWTASLGYAVALIYMPISARFRTNLAQVVFTSLLSRLSALHDRPLPASAEISVEQARGLIGDLLARPLPDDLRLLIIIDGLDEAADFEITADLFPRRAPRGLKVLLAGRPLALRPDPLVGLVRTARDLPLLPSAAVRTALFDAGTDAEVAEQVVRLSQGDPLLLRLYLDALAAGELDRRKLSAAAPGLNSFFARWWDDQLDLWRDLDAAGSNLVETLLCVLACALGPLSRDDLLDTTLVPERPSVFQLDAALSRLGRLIVGAGRTNDLILSHPRFADFIREEWIPASRRRETEQRFISWGDRALASVGSALSPGPSPYLISHFGAHLERAEASQDRFELLTSRYWADCWRSVDPSLNGFLVDVDRRSRAATHQIRTEGLDSALLVALVTCALSSATVRTIANGLNPNVYVASLRLGIWSADTVIEHMAKVRRQGLSSGSLAAVARIVDPERTTEILALALSSDNSYYRMEALKELLPYLAPSGHAHALMELSQDVIASGHWRGLGFPVPVQSALTIAEQLRNPEDRAYALASLLPALSQPFRENLEAVIEGMLSAHSSAFIEDISYVGALQNLSSERRLRVVTRILNQLEDDRARLSALREISPAADAGLVGPLLLCAASVEDDIDRGEALALVAEATTAGHIERFLEIAHGIERPQPRARSLAALGRHHDGPWCRSALEFCATGSWYPSIRAPIIVDACRRLSDPDRLKLESLLMADLNAPIDSRAWDEHDPDWLLADFAETFTQTSPHHALRLIGMIDADEVRALQLASFALHGPPDYRGQAIEMLRRVEGPMNVIDGYVYLVDKSSGDARVRACAEVVQFAVSNGCADYLVSTATEHGWDLERELGDAAVREALTLSRVGDWHELGDALVALAPGASGQAAGDALRVMKRIGYELPINRITQAFANKFSSSQLQSLFSSVKRTPSKAFAASILKDIFPHLPPETKSEALQWVHSLPEKTIKLVEGKIRFLTACAAGQDTPLAEAERLILTLPEPNRNEALATIQRRISPERHPHRRQATNASYSREALMEELRKGRDFPRGVSDPFELLIEQDFTEMKEATTEALLMAGMGERSRLLRVIGGLSPAIHRLCGINAVDRIVAVVRENVESWS